jgi:pimeloyl-ACP methyl ester carboxylesterase
LDILLIAGLWLEESAWAGVAACLAERGDSADLDNAAKHAFAAAIPVPEGVTSAVVTLADPRRYVVPAVLICPELTPAQARELISQGELPELAKIRNLSLVDIDSGHWPMITAPAELARLIDQATAES